MKFILKVILLLAICLFIGYNTNLFFSKPVNNENPSDKAVKLDEHLKDKKLTKDEKKELVSKSSLAKYINKNVSSLEKEFGKPVRIDPSEYGYQSYIFNPKNAGYMQVGVRNQKVQTIYALGNDLNLEPYKIGMSAEKIFTDANLQSDLAFYYQDNYYRFELSEEDLNIHPLVNLGSGVYAQLNFDRMTSKLVSIRYVNKLALIKLHPYEMTYQGDVFTETVSPEKRKKIDASEDQQIFEITNIIRDRYGVGTLLYNDRVATVAYNHSVDMKVNDYFDHESPKYGSLADRFSRANIPYKEAGENLAFNYIDAGAVVEGWLNSEGHRANLLNKSFKEVGNGTFQKYYTQNFLTK